MFCDCKYSGRSYKIANSLESYRFLASVFPLLFIIQFFSAFPLALITPTSFLLSPFISLFICSFKSFLPIFPLPFVSPSSHFFRPLVHFPLALSLLSLSSFAVCLLSSPSLSTLHHLLCRRCIPSTW